MIKNTKKGFSLAELLIAMAIISVIATIGFSMARRSIESAYDQYIYTGYKGISQAITDANANNYALKNNQIANTDFEEHIIDLLNARKEDNFIKAPNGVWYRFDVLSALFQSNPPKTTYYYYIEMRTPTKKQVLPNGTIKTHETSCLAYLPSEEYGILIPFNGTLGGMNLASCTSTITDLHTRIDLLPFYIDDGFTGRTTPDPTTGAMVYHPKTYYSAEDALCEAFGRIAVANYTFNNSCNHAKKDIPTGSVRVENPRKAF